MQTWPATVPDVLTFVVRDFDTDSTGELKESFVGEQVWIENRGELYFPAGCLGRVVKTLEDSGLTVVIEDRRSTGEKMSACHGVLKSLTGRRRIRLQAVVENPLGQVPVFGQGDAKEFCGDVAAYFPQARIAVAVSSKRAARQYADYLEQRLNEGIDVRHSSHQVSKVVTRVSVSTYAWLPKSERIDILLLPEANSLFGKEASDHIMERRPDVGRRYALIPAKTRSDAYDQWTLECVAGAVIVPNPRALVSFTAVFVSVPRMRIPGTTTPQGLMRNLIVRNKVRNRRIGEVATALLRDPKTTLAGLVPNHLAARILSRKDLRIAVLAESAEQARNLAAHLPQWRLCFARPDALNGLPPNQEARNVIVTTTAAAKEGIEADIVIRGTGTSSPLRWQDFRPVGDDHKRGDVLLVDFDDEYHKYAAKHAQHRRTDYEQCGIRVVPMRSNELEPIMFRIPARETHVLPSRWELQS